MQVINSSILMAKGWVYNPCTKFTRFKSKQEKIRVIDPELLILDPVAQLKVALFEGRTLEGRTLEGRTLEGRTLEGRTLEGHILEGRTLEGRTLKGRTLKSRVLDGCTLKGRTLKVCTYSRFCTHECVHNFIMLGIFTELDLNW